MPHKVRVIPFLGRHERGGAHHRAVNTVYEENGRYIGENTDGKGFVEAMQMQGAPIAGKKIVLLGAGGAGKAIGVECALAGAKHITVINRNRERGEDLGARHCRKHALRGGIPPLAGRGENPRVRHTHQRYLRGPRPQRERKAGHRLRRHPSGHGGLGRGVQPRMAAVLREARARGAKAITGLGMLVCQGARNFTPLDGRGGAVHGHVRRLEGRIWRLGGPTLPRRGPCAQRAPFPGKFYMPPACQARESMV